MSERTHLFFKEGKLYLIPDLPTEQHNLHLPVEIEKAKANALPVVNPEVADNTELPFPGNRIVRLRKENEIFEWPGTWEKSVIPFYVQNTGAKLIAPQQPQAEDWQATPKKKKPLDEKLNSLSLKLKDISHAKRVIKDEKGLPIGFEPFNKTLMTQSDAPNEQDKILAEQNAFHLVKALDLIDECYHYLKANPPSTKTMNYNKWESLVEETDYMREFNAGADHDRHNKDDAPNEGREEKTPSSIIDILHAHSIKTEFVAAADKWFATSAPLSYYEAAFNMYADNKFKNLRDQLSKERENSKIKEEELTAEWEHGYNSAMREANEQLEKEREEVRRSHGLISALEQSSASQAQDYHDKFTELINEREKEREIRKELVSTINQLTRGSAFLEKKVEFLIKRASELDKTLT